MADYAGAEHVADKFVMLAIPDEQRRAGTAAAVDLRYSCSLLAGDFDFVLQNAGGPEHADDVGLLWLGRGRRRVGGVLAEIAGRSVDFEFLAIAAGEDFDLGADGALVVVESFEREPQPVILVAAFVAQQNGGTVILSDEQIGGAVVVVVAGDDGAGFLS